MQKTEETFLESRIDRRVSSRRCFSLHNDQGHLKPGKRLSESNFASRYENFNKKFKSVRFVIWPIRDPLKHKTKKIIWKHKRLKSKINSFLSTHLILILMKHNCNTAIGDGSLEWKRKSFYLLNLDIYDNCVRRSFIKIWCYHIQQKANLLAQQYLNLITPITHSCIAKICF
jgi:hypothetical protein